MELDFRHAFTHAAVLFAAGLALHVLVWRRRRPDRHLTALLFVFAIPGAAFVGWSGAAGVSTTQVAAALLLYAALAVSYIQVYPAAQASSPTLWMLLVIGASGGKGISETGLREQLASASMVRDRIDDLVRAGLALEDAASGRLELTPAGRRFVSPFILLRSALGLAPGEG
ncbi:MAG: hypothetical protein HY078_03830 [Elusimicrobia bacterium]|nr:hypothetical protein [Elusimicrobiota bacterium]